MATQLNDWLSIDKISGTGNAEITLTASSYQELVDRTASIKIQAQSTNAILNVRQTALVPSATLDSYEITTYGGGTYTNGITSNVPWTAVVNGDWITIDKTQGESGYTPLSIALDASIETRSGSITFNAEGVVLTLQIYQIYDLNKSYFWIEFESTGATLSGLTNSVVNFTYSFDGYTWETAPSSLSMGQNRKVYLKNSTKILRKDSVRTTLTFSGYSKIGGDMSSIVDMAKNCCKSIFYKNTLITDASELILPWTTLADSCYESMFYGCTSLTTAPKLPATTLAHSCYWSMFEGCTNLTTAPELPATTLVDWCYSSMFQGCTSLTTAPKLPATTLAESCYNGMFDGCTNLTTAPVLPATTLAEKCYSNMFQGCTNLTTAPVLPATTAESDCYFSMFDGCTNLTTAPVLPATTAKNGCYSYMFNGCISLTTAPELPATTLADSCYWGMFMGCTNLTTAPVLLATTLKYYCYFRMFEGCANLTYIKMLATDMSADSCIRGWVKNVSTTGTFVKHPDANLPTGESGIPSGWTVETATE